VTDTDSPAEVTAAAVAGEYPGLRQVHPHALGVPLADVRLDPSGAARYTWSGYEVHVTVGPEAHLNADDTDSTSLQREVRAYATLLVTDVRDATTRGHVEWDMTNPRPDMLFPAAFSAAAADPADPRYASAVLATIGKALDCARIATAHAGRRAAEAAEEQRWERERPAGTTRVAWLRRKREERSRAQEAAAGHAPPPK
jgi:hypothetical protein